MSTSRLLNLLGSSIFCKNHTTPRLISTIPYFRYIKPFPSPSLRFHRCCSSAVVLEENATNYNPESALNSTRHPWPEWVTFVDRLKATGYISESATGAEEKAETEAAGHGGGDGVVYTDMKFLKDACLNFARDRYDIIKSLCRQEMQTLVGKGCPNLLRKAVNSAKRLRAYLGLDEGHVCSACALRGSCDRANITLKESEGSARTVDVVRILLLYALDPLVMDGGTKHEDRVSIEVSARNLLSELTELSETIPPPDLPEPSVKVTQEKKSNSLLRDDNTPDVEMKRGDWICSKCNFMNFARNIRCLKCKTEGPKRVPADEIEMKKGDWNCTQCGFMNFASNIRCLRCREDRPKRQLKPGDWECPSCRFLNFRGNISCKKCNHGRPEEIETRYEDMTWKKPF